MTRLINASRWQLRSHIQ